MRDELLMERETLRFQIRLLVVEFMKEKDSDKALEILTAIKNRSRRVEEINCKLAHGQLRRIFKKEGES